MFLLQQSINLYKWAYMWQDTLLVSLQILGIALSLLLWITVSDTFHLVHIISYVHRIANE